MRDFGNRERDTGGGPAGWQAERAVLPCALGIGEIKKMLEMSEKVSQDILRAVWHVAWEKLGQNSFTAEL